jgi:signal transduction histidine kinase
MPPNGRLPLEILLALGHLALIVALASTARREHSPWRFIPLALYLLLHVVWMLLRYGMALPQFNPDALSIISEYVVMVAPLALFGATLTFVRPRHGGWLWLLPSVVLAGAALALDARLFGPRPVEAVINGRILTQEDWRVLAGGLSWTCAYGFMIGFTWRARTNSLSPLHRNRLRYWTAAVLLAMTSTVATLLAPSIPPLAGGGIALVGALLAVITWRIYYLPDVKVLLRRTVSYAILTLVTFAIYLLGIRVAQSAFGEGSGLGPIFGAVLVAGGLAVGYSPLRDAVQGLTRRVLGSETIDYTASLQDYSQRITQVLDLEALALIVVETVTSALGAARGALFLAEDDTGSRLTLEAVGEAGNDALRLVCPSESPITQRWRTGGGPLLQYDVDILPAYRAVGEAERIVLSRWKMEVYFPIHVMGQLVGALAVGSKRSGDPYFESDMTYLTALTDQTGVALQNARLVSELRGANRQMADLNRDLERANEQLQELDNLKSAFIGVVTHELRSPFAALNFSMQLIQKYGLENLMPEQREQLQQVNEGLKRAETMINNLITFAALLSKQGQLQMAPVDLRQLAQETVKTLESMSHSRDVKMTLQLSGPVPLVMGDRERLSEAIYHLTHNAIKFNLTGGKVTLVCRSTPGWVIVEVADTGVGIPPEKLPEMWQDFTQLADPLRRGVEGMGLGLPLVRYVVKAHGGDVWARSLPNQGSVFGFQIPVAKEEEQPALSG